MSVSSSYSFEIDDPDYNPFSPIEVFDISNDLNYNFGNILAYDSDPETIIDNNANVKDDGVRIVED